MGIELQFNSFSLDKNGDTLEKIAQEMSDLSSQPSLNKNIKDLYFNLSSGSEESQNFEYFFLEKEGKVARNMN